MKKLLNKLFKKQKRNIKLEIENYTDIDLEITVDRKGDQDIIKIILIDKKDLETMILQKTA